MAKIAVESLVLRGVIVACDVVTGLERNGSKQASDRTSAFQSCGRIPAHRFPPANNRRSWRHDHAATTAMDTASGRTGRSGGSRGILAGRSPAQAVQAPYQWVGSYAAGWPCAAASMRLEPLSLHANLRRLRQMAPTKLAAGMKESQKAKRLAGQTQPVSTRGTNARDS